MTSTKAKPLPPKSPAFAKKIHPHSPIRPMLTSESLQLRNFRAISSNTIPNSKNFDVCTQMPYIPQRFNRKTEHFLSTRICQLMNELYYTPVASKD